ncbi:MAG TPA: hypothetical protein VF199_06475 [Bacillales bacterium]
MFELNELRYRKLLIEFERQLKRPLNEKEKAFIEWLTIKEEMENYYTCGTFGC